MKVMWETFIGKTFGRRLHAKGMTFNGHLILMALPRGLEPLFSP